MPAVKKAATAARTKTLAQKTAQHILRRIRDGRYDDGRLPSQRDLAADLGVSRNTVIAALSLLESQGWIETSAKRRATLPAADGGFAQKVNRFLHASRFEAPLMNGAFTRRDNAVAPTGDVIDLSRLCDEHWDDHLQYDLEEASLLEAMARYRCGDTDIYRTTGMEELKEEACRFFRGRGISVTPREMLVVSRRLQAYRLVAEVLVGPKTELWFPELSIVRFYGIGERHTAKRRMLPVADDGRIDFEPMLFSKAQKVVFLVPTRPKPTGRSLTIDERRRLVKSLRGTDTFVFEDRYCELVTDEHLPSLASFDPNKETVILFGSLPTWLTPLCCCSFIVAHERIIEELRASARRDYLTPEFFTQLALTQLLRSGRIETMLERYQGFFEKRLAFVDETLRSAFGTAARWRLPGSFGCVWLELPGIDIPALYRRRKDVDFQPGWFYGEPVRNCRHVLLRYTVPEGVFAEGVRRLKRLCEELSRERIDR